MAMQNRRRDILHLLLVIGVLLLANVLAGRLYTRWDLTKEKRFTLTPATKELLRKIDKPVKVSVYLEGKDLPEGIRSLQKATREMLQDFRSLSGGKVSFVLVDIQQIKNEEKKEQLKNNLVNLGLFPTNLQVNAEQGYREQLIFPGLVMHSGEQEIAVTLLENQLSFGTQGSLNNSINFLEYKLAGALQKLQLKKSPLVAFDIGHGELNPEHLDELVQTLNSQQYSVAGTDISLGPLLASQIDILVFAKPTQPFSEADKFKIDQYIMQGGKVLWLVDGAIASLDSFGNRPSIFAVDMPLDITDLLFRYGVRINTDLVEDLYCNPIPIMEDQGGGAKPILFPWVFHPILVTKGNHPIVKNLDPVAVKFASSMDTVGARGIKKTVLLSTSSSSRAVLTPFEIFLEGAKTQPEPGLFNRQDIPLAVLLEGKFSSAFASRMNASYDTILAQSSLPFRPGSPENRMIVISDGDIAANETDANGNPLPLGYYKYTREVFANRDFVLNCIEYLLDNSGLLEARNRETKMRLLDKTKVNDQKMLWQIILLGGPLLLLGIFAVAYNTRRSRRFTS